MRLARSRRLLVDDIAVDTPSYRAGRGTPLVLLHGAHVTWRAWKPVLPLLEPHHEVIALTLPGHSGGPPWDTDVPVSVDALVDAVIRCLDSLQLDTVHVAGNSLGGWLALELARRQRARSVVAFSPGGAWRSDVRYRAMTFGMYMLLGVMDTLGEHAEALALTWCGRRLLCSFNAVDPEAIDLADLVADIRALRATTVRRELMPALGRNPFAELPDPGCPVRVVWPRHDRLLPFRHFGEPLMQRLPTAELMVLDGVGHVPMIDAPHAVAEHILEVTTWVDREAEVN